MEVGELGIGKRGCEHSRHKEIADPKPGVRNMPWCDLKSAFIWKQYQTTAKFKNQNKTLLWTENEVEVGMKLKNNNKAGVLWEKSVLGCYLLFFGLKSRCFQEIECLWT